MWVATELQPGLPGTLWPRYAESDGERLFTHEVVNIMFGIFLTQPLAYTEKELDIN